MAEARSTLPPPLLDKPRQAAQHLTLLGALLRPQKILTFVLQEVQTALEGKEERQRQL